MIDSYMQNYNKLAFHVIFQENDMIDKIISYMVILCQVESVSSEV